MGPDGTTWRRWGRRAWPLLQQTVAAAVAWLVAVRLLGLQPAPVFAPISAVVALNATLGRRGSNAVRLLVGALIGVLVGEVVLVVVGGGTWPLVLAVFCAMALAQVADGARIVTAQAAVGAIIVTALGDPDEGTHRVVEALLGVGVALVVSQLVFSPEPLRLLRGAAAAVLSRAAQGLQLTAEALERGDDDLAARALEGLRGLRGLLADLDTARTASQRIVRRSVTWRSQRTAVGHAARRAERVDLLAASCLGLARAVAVGTARLGELAPVVRQLARVAADLADSAGEGQERQLAADRALALAHRCVVLAGSAPAVSPLGAACAAALAVAVDVMAVAGVEPAGARSAVAGGSERPRVET